MRAPLRSPFVLGLAGLVSLAVVVPPPALTAAADRLPDRLTPQQMWKLSQELSEPDGFFRSDNLVSNELWFQWVIPDLVATVPAGRVYLGVGPEQNFSFIAALKPKMVFITDVRRGNLHMHLMYKALFELAADRADFFSLLFTKARPAGLTAKSTAQELIDAYWWLPTSAEAVYKENLKKIQDHLTKTRGLPLSADDLSGIEYVYWNFYWHGPAITYSSSTGRVNNNMARYGDLMVATDGAGVSRSYLASEENYRVLKQLHERNLFVPVVGNFAGPKALRAVGKYIRDHGALVGAMYLSNVEQYLYQDGLWNAFCANVATMPLDDESRFIRSSNRGGGGGSGLVNSLGPMLAETRGGCTAQQP